MSQQINLVRVVNDERNIGKQVGAKNVIAVQQQWFVTFSCEFCASEFYLYRWGLKYWHCDSHKLVPVSRKQA